MYYIQPKKSKVLRRVVAIYLTLTVLGLVFLGGLYVGGKKFTASDGKASESGEGAVLNKDAPPPYLLENIDFDLFWDVWKLVKDKYVDQPVLDSKLFYGAVSGIVASLGDPYSAFLDPDTTRKFSGELAGRFEGIGAEIGLKKDQLVIVAPLPDSPAERAGLKPGDRILKIDDRDTTGMPLEIAVSNIRGLKGTTVTLRILRSGEKEPKDTAIVREEIRVKAVTYKELEGGLGYIRIIHFNESTFPLFDEALRATLAKNPKGIVLDLRNNPGGFLEVAVRVASEWITPPAPIVIQKFQGGRQEVLRSEGAARLRGIPTVVLVNPGTASGAEILAGALQDYKAATIVGEKSFGKGSVQDWEQLRGGSSVKITIAEWLTPNGRKINGEGVTPDIEVKLAREDYENEKDPQLEKAVELLLK